MVEWVRNVIGRVLTVLIEPQAWLARKVTPRKSHSVDTCERSRDDAAR